MQPGNRNKTFSFVHFARFVTAFLFISPLFSFRTAQASHITGAELIYECTSPGNYHVTLKMYRDCLSGAAPFDNSPTLFIFESATGNLAYTHVIPGLPDIREVIPDNWDNCVGTPYNYCLEEGVYETDIFLPSLTGGYDIAWARCCRNAAIVNLNVPECEGVTFLGHVPGPEHAICNSMPVFNGVPPLFICQNTLFYFDYSATDVNGDSLVYEISNPFTGVNMAGLGAGSATTPSCFSTNPPQVNAGNPMGPEPYRNVSFAAGHSYLAPFGPGGLISMDPATGFLTVFAPNPGLHVVAISVKEYRAGILLSENKRDFQFYVIPCLTQNPPPYVTHDLSGLTSSGDTVFIQANQNFCYTFTVNDTVPPSEIAVEPVSVTFGGNPGFPGPYATISMPTTTPPVTGTICWQPNCVYAGQTLEIIISVRDTNDCANHNLVFDTVWVTVLPAPVNTATITHDLSGNDYSNDTIYLPVLTPFCYEYTVFNTTGNGNYAVVTELRDSVGGWVFQVHSWSTTTVGDSIFGTVCWESYCNPNTTYMLVTVVTDINGCEPNNVWRDTVWIHIYPPPSPPPVIECNAAWIPSSGDTLLFNVHELNCFNYLVADTSSPGGDSLYVSYSIEAVGGTFSGSLPDITGIFTGDTLSGEFCWTPVCSQVDQLFMLSLSGVQVNLCGFTAATSDTFYIRVVEPPKILPEIGHLPGPGWSHPDTMHLFDADSACFTFFLRDSIHPAFLEVFTSVALASGGTYAGPPPSVSYSILSDSLIEGTVCWNVPCEYSNGSFVVHISGRDTFDCKTPNMVYDSVFIRHVETIPVQPRVCVVSVLSGDAGNGVRWPRATESDAAGYILYRLSDAGTGIAIDTLFTPADTFSNDLSVNPDEGPFCYAVTSYDRCGNESPLGSDFMCTTLLSGESFQRSSLLAWSAFSGFPSGVGAYEIWVRDGRTPSGASIYLNETDGTSLTYNDGVVPYPVMCYRVRAEESTVDCGVESWSNEICLTFPPRIFLPNSFTPNGDNTNEFFTAYGDFIDQFSMQIYDRWGKLIYTTQSQFPGWDGTINGSAASEGMYVYRITAWGYNGDQLEEKGSLLLLR